MFGFVVEVLAVVGAWSVARRLYRLRRFFRR